MDQILPAILLVLVLLAIPLIQHFRFKSKYAGFKDIQAAIQNESNKLVSLRSEFEGVVGEIKDQQAGLMAIIKNRDEVQSVLEKKQALIADFESMVQKMRTEVIEVKKELTACKADVMNQKSLHKDQAAALSELDQQKNALESRIEHLINLESRENTLCSDIEALALKLQAEQLLFEDSRQKQKSELNSIEAKILVSKNKLSEIIGRIDLYSRIDEYTKVGHFEMPDYLYETSVRYQVEIKEVRERQRKLIREKKAVTYPAELMLCADRSLDRKILDGQVQLMLGAFNIECDLLIEKVNPANLNRTLEQIEKRAEILEKSCATLKCGFNIDYVELKFEECKFQFEYILKKNEEQEQQRAIREQMREEVRVQKQYEEAVKEAEREEQKFVRLLERAREHLSQESEQERAVSQAKIRLLEDQLKEAQERIVRAKSMAEQTRRGFVYVISNVGAFGEGVYKIGLTRRLDPQERIDELSSASVPFRFDIHAMCYSEDAPALEYALHKKFNDRRVNAVNFRKEFFRVQLEEIQAAIEEMVNEDVEFVMTARAEDYFQSKRLMAA